MLALSCKTRWLDQDDPAAHERLARTCARCPVSLERLEHDAATGTVTYTSDKADGPTAGRHTFEVTDFIVRLVAHIPDKGQVLQRDYGYYANRARGERRKAARAPEAEPAAAEIDAATSCGLEPALAGGHRRARELLPRRRAPLGRADQADLRGRPARMPEVRRYDADDRADPGAEGDRQAPKHRRTKGRDARAGPWATGLSPPADDAAAAAA